MKTLFALLLLLPCLTFAQSVDLDAQGSNPARVIYDDVQGGSWNIGFDIFPRNTDEGSQSSCQNGNGIPYGIYLADNYQSGNWLQIALVQGRVCVVNGTTWPVLFAHGTQAVAENAWTRIDVDCSSGVLSLTVDGATETWSTSSCSQGPGDVHIGVEVGNYDVERYEPLDGLVDNIVVNSQTDDFTAAPYTGTLANGATISAQDAGQAPPPPPPPPTACEVDPNSVECACETTPHPACDVCTP